MEEASVVVALAFLVLLVIWTAATGALLGLIHLLPGRAWRHQDPARRNAAVARLDDGSILGFMSATDSDPAVRATRPPSGCAL